MYVGPFLGHIPIIRFSGVSLATRLEMIPSPLPDGSSSYNWRLVFFIQKLLDSSWYTAYRKSDKSSFSMVIVGSAKHSGSAKVLHEEPTFE